MFLLTLTYQAFRFTSGIRISAVTTGMVMTGVRLSGGVLIRAIITVIAVTLTCTGTATAGIQNRLSAVIASRIIRGVRRGATIMITVIITVIRVATTVAVTMAIRAVTTAIRAVTTPIRGTDSRSLRMVSRGVNHP